MTPEEKITQLGLVLPASPAAGGNYLPVVRTGNLLYCAGTLSVANGEIIAGQVGREHTVETAYLSARHAALNTLANVRDAVGSLSKIKRVVMLNGFVNAISGFADSPAVINGASDFLIEVLGDAGRHARAAVAVAGLPRNATTEVQMVIEVAD